VLRRRPGAPPAAFVVKHGSLLALAAVAMCLWLLLAAPSREFVSILAATAAGLAVYALHLGATAYRKQPRRGSF